MGAVKKEALWTNDYFLLSVKSQRVQGQHTKNSTADSLDSRVYNYCESVCACAHMFEPLGMLQSLLCEKR